MQRFTHCTHATWPDDGEGWIFPDDVAALRRLIPSHRVLRREPAEQGYVRLRYGGVAIRTLPRMCQPRPAPAFAPGDLVEIRSQLGRRRPGVAIVRDVFWNSAGSRLEYELAQRGMPLAQRYHESDLRGVCYPR